MNRLLAVAVVLLSASLAHAQGTVAWYPATITTANTAKDGTGSVAMVMTANNTAYIDRLVFRATGTNVQTVARVFLNNGETNATASNNVLFAEITLDATTLSETTALADEELPLDIYLPAGHRVFVTIGTTVAAGWRVTAVTKTPTEVVE